MDQTIRANLRKILAYLYSTEADIRRICDDAGIDLTRIVFKSSAINDWHAILTEAHKVNQVVVLLEKIEEEYNSNKELSIVSAAYRHSINQSKADENANADVHNSNIAINSYHANKTTVSSLSWLLTADFSKRIWLISIITVSVITGIFIFVRYFAHPTTSSSTSEKLTVNAPTTTPVHDEESKSLTTATPSSVNKVERTTRVIRSGPGEHEYVIMGEETELYNPGDFLVVYAKDNAGIEFDAAVMYVVDNNPDNLIAKVIFQNADLPLDSLAGLPVDNDFENVDLTRMVTVSDTFVGFTVTNGVVRINPNVQVPIGTELLAVQLTVSGDALITSPPLTLQIDEISNNGELAKASILGSAAWPPLGTLLIPSNPSNISRTYIISISSFTERNDICVYGGDKVTIRSSDKDTYGTLLYRIKGEANWRSYPEAKQFIAKRAGCLEFDIETDPVSVLVDVQPARLY